MDDFEWNITNEGYLLDAMVGHKPVGINRHFHMFAIWKKFTDTIKKNVPSSKIWEHLETMYDMEGLNDNEPLHFSKEIREFSLPDFDFQALKNKKEEKEKGDEKKGGVKGRETPKNMKESSKREDALPKNRKNERRDSRDKDATKEVSKLTGASKKDNKKDAEKSKSAKGRTSQAAREDAKKNKREESPRPAKRPTRGSMKPDDYNLSGKASPLTLPQTIKRRRI